VELKQCCEGLPREEIALKVRQRLLNEGESNEWGNMRNACMIILNQGLMSYYHDQDITLYESRSFYKISTSPYLFAYIPSAFIVKMNL